MKKQQFFQGKFSILIDKISAFSASIKSAKSVVFCVKIGKISAIFQSKTLIPQNKNEIFKKFLTYFPKSSYENHKSIFEDFFRIKHAGSSNYRGDCFSLPAKRSQLFTCL